MSKKKNVTIVIVTAAIIVLVSIFAVFLVTDKIENKYASSTTQQASDLKGQKSENKTSDKVENISIEAPNKDNSSVENNKKKTSKNDGKVSKDGSSSKKNDKIKEEDKKGKKSKSQKGLPIDWFDD